MTRVDFYLLDGKGAEVVIEFTCRLIEKIRSNSQKAHVHADDQDLLYRIDQALWNFKPESFIPHCLLDIERSSRSAQAPASANQPAQTAGRVEESVQVPYSPDYDLAGSSFNTATALNVPAVDVTIGSCLPPTHCSGVLINLADDVPTFFSRFDRTLEIVNSTDSSRKLSRERYRFYQQRGYPLKHHDLAVDKSG